jgi:transcriptional regulator with XRE-family HTH domain
MTDPSKPDSRSTAAMLERIRNRRTALGLSGVELAQRAQISPSYVSLIERGFKIPNEDAAARLARALEDDEDLYRAWARAERYGLDKLDQMQRLDDLTSDAQTTRILASGRDLPRVAPAAPRAAAAAPAQRMRSQEPRAPSFSAPEEELEPTIAELDYAAEAEEAAADGVVEVPVLPAGTDPRRMLDATAHPPLHLDARLIASGDVAGLFAYELDRAAAARLGDIASEGDYVVLTRRVRRLASDRFYAVRGEDEGIRLGRVLFKTNSLLLLPAAGGTDIEVVPLREGETWRERVLGAVVLTLKRWG